MTHYELLGVKEDAGIDEIRKAYHRLALKLHPDRNPGDKEGEERFKEISAAYNCLQDPRQRETYDRGRRRTSPRPERRPGRSAAPPPSSEWQRWAAFRAAAAQARRRGAGGFAMDEDQNVPRRTYPVMGGVGPIKVHNVVMPGFRVFATKRRR